GDFDNVDVIDVLVSVGDEVAAEDPLITLESDKATMDVPAPRAGTIAAIDTAVGAKVSEGDRIVTLTVRATGATAPARAVTPAGARSADAAPAADRATTPRGAGELAARTSAPPRDSGSAPRKAHASPSVRRFARELGVDVTLVNGSGPKGRILKADVQAYVKDVMHGTRGQAGGGFALPAAPEIDFSKFGETETTPLNKIRKLTGQNLHRSWLTVPHVFQMDEADITELEEFRRSKADEAEKKGTKLTLLAFLVKAVVVALKKYPDFNASLSPDGEALIHKKYFHVGVAVNTPHGLVVPVIRDVDKKGLYELALEARELAAKARERKITPAEMQGACFTISSLGGVGGTHFTPIINMPEVAILGVSPSTMKPVWRDGEFEPRLMLPFTLSYDHRVIDGVAAAQFTRFLTTVLGDIRHILL
ncbi:MAG: dihydrolipoyllysine-residue acetyltransferase, partial [Gammaproteobacteria bacterium]